MIIWQQKQTNKNLNKILQKDPDFYETLQISFPIKRYGFYDTMGLLTCFVTVTG